MKNINQDLKSGAFKPVYLLYGEERYLIHQYKKQMKKVVTRNEDTMNYSYFEGDGIEPAEIVDLAQTLPFFADRRLIIVENSGFFQKSPEYLAEEMAKLPDTSVLIFVEKLVDKRSKLFKAVTKYGYACEFKRQTEDVLQKWILKQISKANKGMKRSAYELFIEKTGNDMETIHQELEKLICYAWDKEVIDIEDVQAVTTEQISNHIFDMVDAIAEHNNERALKLYDDLLVLREPPMRILYLILRHFQILLTVSTTNNQGLSNKEIAEYAGCPEWTVRKYVKQCRSFAAERIKKAIEEGLSLETQVKTGGIDDQLAVELFIVRYSAG